MLQVSELKRHYDPDRQITDFSVTFIMDGRVKVARASLRGNISSLSPSFINELRAAAAADLETA